MPTEITAQNGAMIKQTTNIAASGCAGVKDSKTVKLTRAQLLAKALKACRKTTSTHSQTRRMRKTSPQALRRQEETSQREQDVPKGQQDGYPVTVTPRASAVVSSGHGPNRETFASLTSPIRPAPAPGCQPQPVLLPQLEHV